MNRIPPPAPQSARPPRTRAAFTLPEVMIALSLLSLVTVALLYSQLFGMRLFNITSAKLGASRGARAVLNQVRDDIRSAKTVYVGNATSAGFTNLPANAPQAGNAVQIFPLASTNAFVVYYLDQASQQLRRMTNGSATAAVLASSVTNQLVFQAEDYAGNVLTNDQNNRVIRMSLEFYQWEFPMAQAASGAAYDYYHLQTRVTRRAIQ